MHYIECLIWKKRASSSSFSFTTREPEQGEIINVGTTQATSRKLRDWPNSNQRGVSLQTSDGRETDVHHLDGPQKAHNNPIGKARRGHQVAPSWNSSPSRSARSPRALVKIRWENHTLAEHESRHLRCSCPRPAAACHLSCAQKSR